MAHSDAPNSHSERLLSMQRRHTCSSLRELANGRKAKAVMPVNTAKGLPIHTSVIVFTVYIRDVIYVFLKFNTS